MDSRILKHYEAELSYLREMGGEFAQSYPKVASRLGMDDVEVLDPYVERILEGSAFLSARVQLELELQYPAFTSQLLEIVYPHYLAPIPSMMIANMAPDMDNPAVDDGFVLARGTQLRSELTAGTQSACVFTTAADLTLWPVEITEAEYIDGRGALVAAGVAHAKEARAAIRLRLSRAGGKPIAELPLDTLNIFLGGQGVQGWQLHELLCTQTTALVARSADRRDDWVQELAGGIRARGFSSKEALLPTPRQSFDGYRLLQEYFAMPERFHFVDMEGLSQGIARSKDSHLDVYILFSKGMPEISAGITPEAFSLNCVPAINLFEKRCDRVQVTGRDVEHHIVADRTAPLDFEIFALKSVTGISKDGEDNTPFTAFYSANDFTPASGGFPAYFTQRRKMRQRTERERLKGARTSYLGSETFVSLVDGSQTPYAQDLAQLSVQALVTNRDLTILLSTGGSDIFHLPGGGPVKSISTPVTPTRPRPTLAQGDAAWRLISHLSLNYLSITDNDERPGEQGGAMALRELLGLYAPQGDRTVEFQLEGLLSVKTRPIVRRISDGVMSTAVRGLEITLNCDESLFEGSSVYQLGSVLQVFFQKYASINSFTETVLTTLQRGEIARWKPETGRGRIL